MFKLKLSLFWCDYAIFNVNREKSTTLRDSMYRALSYSARLDQPAAGKVLETANGGCLVDQKSGTDNYKWSVRGKGMETWPKAFSKYHF